MSERLIPYNKLPSPSGALLAVYLLLFLGLLDVSIPASSHIPK